MRMISKCVVMLRVEESREMLEVANGWIRYKADERFRPKRPGHLTVVFVGKDVSQEVADAALAAANSLRDKVPHTLKSSGALAMYGNKTHLVAKIESSIMLDDFRRQIIDLIEKSTGKPIRQDRYGFNPHITLAESREIGQLSNISRITPRVHNVTGLEVKIGDDYVEIDP